MRAMRGDVAAVLVMLLVLGCYMSGAGASAQGTNGPNVIIRLRLAGDSVALPPMRSCLADKLSQMPDVKVVTVPTEGARFIVDVIAAKSVDENIFASIVVAKTFPMERFRPRIQGRGGRGCSAEEHPLLHSASAARARSGSVL